MAKKVRGSKEKGERASRWDLLLYFALLVISGLGIWAIIYYDLWSEVTDWYEEIAGNVWDAIGLGILLIILAILILIFLMWKRRISSLFRYGLKWLGAIAILFAAWGIMAFWDLGGSFGMGIIEEKNFGGAFKIFALLFLAFILIAPQLLIYFVKWIVRKINNSRIERRQRAAMKPIVYKKVMPPPKDVSVGKTADTVPKADKEVTQPVKEKENVNAPVQKGLRQIAQDVWKKYGQSSAAQEVDGWKLPPVDILDDISEKEAGQADNMQRARKIEEALKSYGVEAKVVQINAGPTVTQFGVEPGWDIKTREVKDRDKDGTVQTRLEEISRTRVKVDRITSLGNDLALALAASSIRIEAPVPGKSIIGIEVPNTVSTSVSLRGVIETSVFQKIASKSKLAIALGKGAGGEAGAADLAKMPHLLIAGATGSGKTVCLNTIISCLLMQNTPDELRFIMIDPKRVELTPYNSIPQLAVPVIVDAQKAIEALRWLNQEMDNRYQQLARAGVRNIEGYNKNRAGKDKMPYLILVIDELADLMMAGFDEVEHILCRLAQLARAIGIHLIVATQRPSVDVVTGLIKANFPTRLSFAVTSQVDSRTILDSVGAEKLLGRGDMLFMPTDAAKPKRLQGCFVSDAEIERLVYFWGSQHPEEITPLKIEPVPDTAAIGIHQPPKDALLEEAKKLAAEHGGQISTSFLQRRLQIGYPRAARLKELLDEEMEKEGKQTSPKSLEDTSGYNPP